MKVDAKPGEGLPLPGMAARQAVERWAIGRLIDYRRSLGLNTAIVSDLNLDTMCVTFAPGDENELTVLIDTDTYHGGHFQQIIPWSPINATAIVAQIAQAAGGVVHA